MKNIFRRGWDTDPNNIDDLLKQHPNGKFVKKAKCFRCSCKTEYISDYITHNNGYHRVPYSVVIKEVRELLTGSVPEKPKIENFVIRLLKGNYPTIIIMALLLGSATMSGFFFGYAYGANHTLPDEHGNYTFNMTQEMIEEGRLLPFCMVDAKIKIDGLDDFCQTRYGGINTDYGEPIK